MSTMGFGFANPDIKPNITHVQEAASQSFKKGDLVYKVSGKATIASSDQILFGIAQKDASGTTNTYIPVATIDATQEYMAEADTTTAITQEGIAYGLNIGTAGSMSVDIGDTTTTSVRVIRLHPADGAKANGRLIVRFKNAVLQVAES